ncbi:MAG: hypothetical protein PHH30_11740, partial [Bacteroidales bacterium]|nr:hypothetical protein [Bacteroidales bacterium]
MQKKEIIIILVSLLVLAGLYFAYQSSVQNKDDFQEFSIFCDFESQTDTLSFVTDNKDYAIYEGLISNEIYFEGKQSLFIPNWEVFHGFLTLDNL